MSITRRSLLHMLGVLPVAYSLKSGAQASGMQAGAHPSPKSIFVIFEGPWLIYQSDRPGKPLIAISAGTTMPMHSCGFQTWNDAKQVSETAFPAGVEWNISALSYNPPTSFEKVFSDSYGRYRGGDKFVWVTGTGREGAGPPVVTGQPGDRTVVLPLPSHVYVGGFLTTAKVSGSSSGILKDDGVEVQPHVVTIFEYAAPVHKTVSVSLKMGDLGQTTTFMPNAHLVFRMRHSDSCGDEVKHVKEVFKFLTSHISLGQSSILFDLSDTSYRHGSNTDGIGDDEMGLKFTHDCSKQDTFANCAGGGMIVG
jgi:hypothetical protein